MDLRTPPEAPEREFRSPSRLVRVGVTLVVIVVSFAAVALAARWFAGLASGGDDAGPTAGAEVAVVIPDGASARRIGGILADAGVVDSSSGFESEVRDRGLAGRLRAGSYTLTTGMDDDALFDLLVNGPPAAETYRLTVIEGLRIEQVLDSLAAQTPWTVEEYSAALVGGSVVSTFLPEDGEGLAAWEGLLFPDTYEFVVDASPAEVLQKMSDTLDVRMGTVATAGLDDLGIDRYELLTVASLIEKEAKLDDERPLIASVIFNRLDAGMPLQIDATIIYALGENPGRVTLADLEIDSPYNTYRNPGLPPGPIGTVRLSSLQAAAEPAETDYLYYALIDPSGEHGFTADYDEFLRFKQLGKETGAIP